MFALNPTEPGLFFDPAPLSSSWGEDAGLAEAQRASLGDTRPPNGTQLLTLEEFLEPSFVSPYAQIDAAVAAINAGLPGGMLPLRRPSDSPTGDEVERITSFVNSWVRRTCCRPNRPITVSRLCFQRLLCAALCSNGSQTRFNQIFTRRVGVTASCVHGVLDYRGSREFVAFPSGFGSESFDTRPAEGELCPGGSSNGSTAMGVSSRKQYVHDAGMLYEMVSAEEYPERYCPVLLDPDDTTNTWYFWDGTCFDRISIGSAIWRWSYEDGGTGCPRVQGGGTDEAQYTVTIERWHLEPGRYGAFGDRSPDRGWLIGSCWDGCWTGTINCNRNTPKLNIDAHRRVGSCGMEFIGQFAWWTCVVSWGARSDAWSPDVQKRMWIAEQRLFRENGGWVPAFVGDDTKMYDSKWSRRSVVATSLRKAGTEMGLPYPVRDFIRSKIATSG